MPSTGAYINQAQLDGFNNVWTVGTLLRYNSMISKSIYDILGIVPSYISTYNSRKYAWPDLIQKNDKNSPKYYP